MSRKVGNKAPHGLISGMHTHEAFEHFFKLCKFNRSECKIETLKNGVTRVILDQSHFVNGKSYANANIKDKLNGMRIKGTKTLWPKGYSSKDILDAAQYVMKNGIRKNNRFTGKTKNGIKTIVHIKNDLINTCFPDWYQ